DRSLLGTPWCPVLFRGSGDATLPLRKLGGVSESRGPAAQGGRVTLAATTMNAFKVTKSWMKFSETRTTSDSTGH
ncbi:hypothetical protein GBAR_LOCUS23012, partial [Geodia barretti]